MKLISPSLLALTLFCRFSFSGLLYLLYPACFLSTSTVASKVSGGQYQIILDFGPNVAQSERAPEGSLDDFISSETPVAWQGILSNIGSDGTGSNGGKVAGAAAGLVVASPSKTNPDYFYSWTRDSALTFKALVDSFIAGNSSFESEIQSYVYAQARLQTLSNPSGNLADGSGLGEPKFEVDGIAFTGDWGRPQRDGPALRATALIAYSRYLISQGDTSTVSSTIWPIISNDLSYVAQYWNQTTFGLWEEVLGSSFFTTAVQYRALVEGNILAQQIGESCVGCTSEAAAILCFMQSFWNGEHISANINANTGRSSLDASTLLASIHTFDSAAGCDDATFQPCSAKALANHKATTESFRNIYAINQGTVQGSAVAVGRYPEDVYQGGNPWYLTTLAAAEQLYDALYQWNKIGSLDVTDTNLAFFKDYSPDITTGTYSSSSPTYSTLTSAVKTHADGYFSIVQRYTPSSGALAEQFSRNDGTPLSAQDLTWSYTSFLTASARRSGQMPASWGFSNANTIPSICSASSTQGTYAPPPITSPTGPCPSISSVLITFNVAKPTTIGQTVLVSGNTSTLGSWDPGNAVPCSADSYTQTYPKWYVSIQVPVGTVLEYKYYLRQSDGSGAFEEGGNRVLQVAEGVCERVRSVADEWRG